MIEEKSKIRPRELTINKIKLVTVLFGAVGLIASTAPFWHIFFDRDSTDAFLGFTNVRRFLYAFGIQFSLFICSTYIFWLTRFIDTNYRQIRVVSNIVAGCFIFSATYFIIWIFWVPSPDYPPHMYYLMIILSSVLIGIATYFSAKFSVALLFNYHHALKTAVEWILDIRSRVTPEFAFMAHPHGEKENGQQHLTKRENSGLTRKNDGLHMLLSMSDEELDEFGYDDIEDWLDH